MVVHYRPRREKESDRQKAALLNGKFSRAALIVYGIFGLFPLDKSYYMGVYSLCFHRQNIRNFVNVSSVIFGC